jgi:hypothetical protein
LTDIAAGAYTLDHCLRGYRISTRKIVVVLAKPVICCEIEAMSCQLYCPSYSTLGGISLHDRNALARSKAFTPYAESVELNSEASLFPAK